MYPVDTVERFLEPVERFSNVDESLIGLSYFRKRIEQRIGDVVEERRRRIGCRRMSEVLMHADVLLITSALVNSKPEKAHPFRRFEEGLQQRAAREGRMSSYSREEAFEALLQMSAEHNNARIDALRLPLLDEVVSEAVAGDILCSSRQLALEKR